MKKTLLILFILFCCSSVTLAFEVPEFPELPVQIEVGSVLSLGFVDANDKFNDSEQTLVGVLGFLAASRGSGLVNVRYPINDMIDVGGEIEAGYMTITVEETSYSIIHIPVRAFARVNYGSLAVAPYVGVNNMINNYFSPNTFSNTLEFGVKLHLGRFFIQYGKDMDLQNTIFDTKLTYTRFGLGYQTALF